MKFRSLHEAKVILAVGLPLAWAKSQAAYFKKYLMQEQELFFSFRRENYRVHLCSVEVFPQGFAAVCSAGAMKGEDICANAKGYEYLAAQKQRRQAV